ncbi:MAG: hypothetical protein QM330_06590 [Acidobacteriota bacterium]|nr:hypothetical protein [Acidobacteriota bacterium]NLT32057.1 hypothetical protein [Acidobacteriota bacterium]
MPPNQQVRKIWRCPLPTLLLLLCLAPPLAAQPERPSLPDPVKFMNTFDQVANMTRAVLEDMGYAIERDDRKEGKITTRPHEFITGSLTSSEMDKVAVGQDPLTGNWIKARQVIETVMEIISPSETMVTVHATVSALNRDVDGTEKWVTLDSRGVLERRVLGRISVKLMGSEEPVKERKGFWGQKPQPVDPRQPRFPNAPGR